jgi:DNA polymerase III gamma/tau subunit
METNGDLHTKYRPKTFDAVLGQRAVVKSIKNVLTNKSSRAFLFVGPGGTGKTTLARIISKEVGCRPESLYEINAADNTGVDDMREIVDGLRFKPMGGGAKMVILDEAQRLSGNAWDILLKPMEEPPEHVYWALCSTNPAKIPDTIKQRCQVYNLKPGGEEDLEGLVQFVVTKEGMEVDEEVLHLVVKKANGSFRRALTLLSQARGCKDRAAAARLLKEADGEDGEVGDLCRLLMKGPTWEQAMTALKPLKDTNAESIRIPIVNYFTAVALNAKSDKAAGVACTVLSAFGEPYPDTNNIAPVLVSLAQVILQ